MVFRPRLEEQKGKHSVEQLEETKNLVERELSFEDGINSALVTTILDHIIVKKESTKEEIHLDIHLKIGDPYGVVLERQKSSFRFNCLI